MTLLQQAIGNLVDNAIAHSPAGGVVTVSLAVQGDKLCLTIQDQGPGLPADELGRLGERFYRVGATRPGSGLGLSIVRRVVALHGGQIEFTSPGGLCAMLHLPLVMLADQELA
jgi:signal transduction histidine kinase